MSKSLGNVVSPTHLVEKYGLDQTRYFLMREVPFGNDGNFSRNAMAERINSELSNNIGNLAQRTLSMVQKNCGGKVPDPKPAGARAQDQEIMDLVQITMPQTPDAVMEQMERCQFSDVLANILSMASFANEYIDREAPWKQKKEAPEQMQATLYHLCEAIRCISIMIQPFIPDSSSKILDMLSVPGNERSFAHLTADFSLKPGVDLPAPEPVFPRFQMDDGS